MSRLLKAGILQVLPSTPAQVMVVNMEEDLMALYLILSQKLRQTGLNVVTSFDKRNLGKQLQLADKQGIRFCVIIGSEEAAAEKCSVKDLQNREQIEVSWDNLAEEIKGRLF